MSRRTWPIARRYAVAPLALGLPLAVAGRRTGWALLAAGGAVVAFFRDPERPLPSDPALVVAASDGFVTGVDEDVEEPWLPGGRATRVTVFLSLTDVHVNRSPVAGRLEREERLGSGFAPALFAGAQDNRRNRLLLDGPAGPVVVVQVAGALARTITNWVRVGDRVAAGERLGLIHFGSRTDVLLPPGAADVLVRKGTRVTAGVTPLARLRGRG
ncbi:phosphatidylserine decarboxylase [Vallicoccus soli]|uniref:phosphatidylserine decarboxylase n=1 Tax=Vallicoccus soli TaxID=2339232 RepID=UPI0014035A9B|nr:phosphatidylserine decarboxylase [Vallicoccus soli]